MHKIYRFVWVWLSLLGFVTAGESVIVLAYGSKDAMIEQKQQYESYAQTHKEVKADAKVVSFSGVSVLEVGPFVRDDALALLYMRIKALFPHAVIIENKQSAAVSKHSNPVEKKVYIEKKVFVEKVDDTLWIALFGLAIVGILFMFLSSDQIKRLKEEHEKIKSKHKKLEEKQHEVLASMGENIHTLAKETMGHTSILAEKVKETPLYEEMEKVMYNENELLDVTGDLIKFLRLKSKKVVIQNEIFNFNNVLNEVAGILNHTYKQNDVELIFAIDKEVPRFMWTDSLHLGQILTNLIEYFIQHSQNKEISLSVTTRSSLKEGLQLHCVIKSDVVIENKEKIFESYYDEVSRRYVGLGLFVAKELTHLMDGTLEVVEHEQSHAMVLTLPIEEKHKERRKYRLPDKGLVGKKILIVDKSMASAEAVKKLFAYFRAEVTVLTTEAFGKNIPNFTHYDIVAFNNTLFSKQILHVLKQTKKKQGLKVISLNNLFSSLELIEDESIDISLVKPLTQEYVFDTLIELYAPKTESQNKHHKKAELQVYRDAFPDIKNVTLEQFSKFKGKHILIVEDNLINQKVVLSVLDKADMILSTAVNGEEAVDFVRNSDKKIDFIFMDINMPVMDGYRAAELIRNDERFRHIAIVALTALVSEHEIDKMFDSGMNAYLSKPVRVDKLYAALDMFLSEKIPDISTSTPVVQQHIEALPGLDIQEGLSHMKENTIFYQEVLREFMDAYAQSDSVFEKLVREQRFLQVKMLCLDMKGLTGTIGAKEMHVLINEIHQHILYNKPELLHSYISRYRDTLATLMQSIEHYLAI